MQKVRSHLVFKLRFLLLIELPVQDLFTSYLLSFQRSLTVLFTIAQYIIFSLRGWFPYIQTSYLSSYLLFFWARRPNLYYYGTFTLYGLSFQTNYNLNLQNSKLFH